LFHFETKQPVKIASLGGMKVNPSLSLTLKPGADAHPPIMMIPTTAELRTAVEVLKMLGQRLNEETEHMTQNLPKTPLGDQYAAHVHAREIEQTSHIEKVSMQLQNWREELLEQQKQRVAQSI
jgi:hypothetical protein